MRTRQALAAILVLAFSLAPVGCRKNAVSPSRPNLILVSIDTLRADRLGSYGYDRPTTPALDRLAREGVVFERALAPSPWTLPSHATLLTGLLPERHGMQKPDGRLPDAIPTLAEALQEAGYLTAGFVNSPYLLPATNLARGFASYRIFPKVQGTSVTLSAGRAIGEIEEWLGANAGRGQPFFVFFHTADVHSDYMPSEQHEALLVRPYQGDFDGRSQTLRRVLRGEVVPSPDDIRHASDLYDAAIRQLDDHLAAFLAFLDARGLARDTVVMVTSDHGEEFFEHGGVMHGYTLFQEMLAVPLIVRGPGVPAGRRVSRIAQLADVPPTLLGLAGVAATQQFDGRDLAAEWSDAPPAEAPGPALAESVPRRYAPDVRNHTVSVTTERYKLIRDFSAGTSRLYDLVADPAEQHDLAGEQPTVVAELLRIAEGYRALEPPQAPGESDLSATQAEQLRALGYAD
jgi:arylsulfatase A-like enzyme